MNSIYQRYLPLVVRLDRYAIEKERMKDLTSNTSVSFVFCFETEVGFSSRSPRQVLPWQRARAHHGPLKWSKNIRQAFNKSKYHSPVQRLVFSRHLHAYLLCLKAVHWRKSVKIQQGRAKRNEDFFLIHINRRWTHWIFVSPRRKISIAKCCSSPSILNMISSSFVRPMATYRSHSRRFTTNIAGINFFSF